MTAPRSMYPDSGDESEPLPDAPSGPTPWSPEQPLTNRVTEVDEESEDVTDPSKD